jgi:hypothetical protein
MLLDRREERLEVPDRRRELDVVPGLEERRRPLADQVVILGEDDADHGGMLQRPSLASNHRAGRASGGRGRR